MRKALVVSPMANTPITATGEICQTAPRSNLKLPASIFGAPRRDSAIGTSETHIRIAMTEKTSKPAIPMTGSAI